LTENKIIDKAKSNNDIDWKPVYDHYETQMREIFRANAKGQNESFCLMLSRHAAKYLRKESTFCEIGFGAGLTLRYMSEKVGSVVGLDVSPKNIELTKRELKEEGFKNIEVHYSNVMQSDVTYKKQFDIIAFIHGLEHFSDADYPVFFSTIKDYLKEDGIFTGALPFKLPFSYRMCPHCHKTFELDGHLSSHDLISLRKVFEENGFEVLFLDNFNKHYYLKSQGTLKYIYNIIKFRNQRDKFHGQIEYIVRRKRS
jgi:cyclopropane fatty-acyl-phospholipid synthase-like methyltransferase